MKTLASFFSFLLALPLFAAPPVNDSYANRTTISNTADASITATNVEATTQSGENTFNGAMGATVWWEWTAASSGWTSIDTVGSEIDTILRVSTATGVNGTTFGFNDDLASGYVESSLTFLATAGTTYYIHVGGYDDGSGAQEGALQINITTGAAATPEVWPSIVTHSPSTANVTSANATVTTTITVDGIAGRTGNAEMFYRRPNGTGLAPTITAETAFTVNATTPVPATLTYDIPRYSAPGTWNPRITLVTSLGAEYQYGNSTSGRPYLLTLTALTVTNTGTSDTVNPVLSAFSISPNPLNVNSGPANLTISATLTDATSGINTIQVWLYHPTNEDLDFFLPVSLTSGTINSGTWTGTVAIPKEYPTASYSVNIFLQDKALNTSSYGAYGTLATPGGNVTLPISGGGAYWAWAYSSVYLYSDDVDFNQDPNGDGLDNLTCYAFGLDPLFEAAFDELPQANIDATTNSLRMEYFQIATTSGVTYTTQFSDNMITWTDATNTPTELDNDGQWKLMEVLDTETVNSKPSRYSRVKLTYTDP